MPTTISAIPYELNLTCRRGVPLLVEIKVVGIDYTGYTLRGQIKNRVYRRLMMEVTPIMTSYDTGSNISISKSSQQMELPAGTYMYDVAATNPDGDIEVDIIYGILTITDDVTQNIHTILVDDDDTPIIT